MSHSPSPNSILHAAAYIDDEQGLLVIEEDGENDEGPIFAANDDDNDGNSNDEDEDDEDGDENLQTLHDQITQINEDANGASRLSNDESIIVERSDTHPV
jgi:hypothetical protein